MCFLNMRGFAGFQQSAANVIIIICCITSCKTEIRFTKSAKCGYLETTKDQDNSYIKHHLLCCMCPRGTHWAGDCNRTHPNTTVCTPCQYSKEDPSKRHYVHFDANMQEECFRQRPLYCNAPKVLLEGSAEKQAKCVCPDGMKEGNNRDCVPVHKPTPAIKVTISPNLSSNNTDTPPKPSETNPTESKTTTLLTRIIIHSTTRSADTDNEMELNSSTRETMATTPQNPTTKSSDIAHKPDHTENNGLPSWIIGIVFAVILIAVIGLACAACKKKYQKSPQNCTPTKNRLNVDNDDNSSVMYTPTDSPANSKSALIAKTRTSPGEKLTQTPQRLQQEVLTTSGNPPTTNYAHPIKSSPQHNRHDSGPVQHPLLANDNYIAEVEINSPLLVGPSEAQIQAQKSEDFATLIGQKFGQELQEQDVLPVFRAIIGTNNEVEFEDLRKKHQFDRKEFVYQLMQLAIHVKGRELTPQCLLHIIESLHDKRQRLVDIIKDEMIVQGLAM